MRTYADASDVSAWTGQPEPDGVTQLVRSASVLVESACRADLYDTDPAGLPVDPDVVEAMRDAVCAQVALWVSAGIDPVAGAAGVEASVTSSRILDGQVSFDGATTDRTKRSAARMLCREAYLILRNAGLASSVVSNA